MTNLFISVSCCIIREHRDAWLLLGAIRTSNKMVQAELADGNLVSAWKHLRSCDCEEKNAQHALSKAIVYEAQLLTMLETQSTTRKAFETAMETLGVRDRIDKEEIFHTYFLTIGPNGDSPLFPKHLWNKFTFKSRCSGRKKKRSQPLKKACNDPPEAEQLSS